MSRAAAGAALTLLLVGCSDDGSTGVSAATADDLVLSSAAGPPGTPIAEGFTVVGGTTLIGDRIPAGIGVIRDGRPILDEGWSATSIIDGGRPRAIVADYLAQAEHAGLVDQVAAACRRDRGVVLCSGSARTTDRADPRTISIDVVRGTRVDVASEHFDRPAQADIVSDHVVISLSTLDLFWESGPDGYPDDPTATLPPVRLPAVADVGERISSAGETFRTLRVQEGSRLAGPPHLNLGDATGGVTAILEVTGDPDEVLQRYLDHLTDDGLEASEPERLDIDGAALTTAHMSESGGDQYSFTLVERRGRPIWLRITGSHD